MRTEKARGTVLMRDHSRSGGIPPTRVAISRSKRQQKTRTTLFCCGAGGLIYVLVSFLCRHSDRVEAGRGWEGENEKKTRRTREEEEDGGARSHERGKNQHKSSEYEEIVRGRQRVCVCVWRECGRNGGCRNRRIFDVIISSVWGEGGAESVLRQRETTYRLLYFRCAFSWPALRHPIREKETERYSEWVRERERFFFLKNIS